MRPMHFSDAENIYRAAQDPEIPKFTTLPSDYSIELAIEFSKTSAVERFINKTELVFVIEDSRFSNLQNSRIQEFDSGSGTGSDSGSGLNPYPYSNGFSGVMSLHSIDIPNHRAEIGYWLAKEARGKGICTKAAEMITEYGLMTIGFKRIDGIVDVRNEPSKRALLNAGYEFEGILKKYVTRRDGSQLDMALYAVTRD